MVTIQQPLWLRGLGVGVWAGNGCGGGPGNGRRGWGGWLPLLVCTHNLRSRSCTSIATWIATLRPVLNPATRSLTDAVEAAAVQRQERLESELHGHKTNLIKESIRQSHNALGDFFYSRGDLQVCSVAGLHGGLLFF